MLPASIPLRMTISLTACPGAQWQVSMKDQASQLTPIVTTYNIAAREHYSRSIERLLRSQFWKLCAQQDSPGNCYCVLEWCGDFTKVYDYAKSI